MIFSTPGTQRVWCSCNLVFLILVFLASYPCLRINMPVDLITGQKIYCSQFQVV